MVFSCCFLLPGSTNLRITLKTLKHPFISYFDEHDKTPQGLGLRVLSAGLIYKTQSTARSLRRVRGVGLAS